MDTPEHERYVFLRFAFASISEAIRILDGDSDDLPLWTRYAALRYAVVCYLRPFTQGETKFAFPQPKGPPRKKLALPPSVVPASFAKLHEELFRYRHKAYAHTDVVALNPRLFIRPASEGFVLASKPVDSMPLHVHKPKMLGLFSAVRDELSTQLRLVEVALGPATGIDV